MLSMLYIVKPNNTGALFALMAIMGATSLTMLPVALELAVELTRNADGSSAILWFALVSHVIFFITFRCSYKHCFVDSCNLFGIMFVLGTSTSHLSVYLVLDNSYIYIIVHS